jgi:hypothetical protein
MKDEKRERERELKARLQRQKAKGECAIQVALSLKSAARHDTTPDRPVLSRSLSRFFFFWLLVFFGHKLEKI